MPCTTGYIGQKYATDLLSARCEELRGSLRSCCSFRRGVNEMKRPLVFLSIVVCCILVIEVSRILEEFELELDRDYYDPGWWPAGSEEGHTRKRSSEFIRTLFRWLGRRNISNR